MNNNKPKLISICPNQRDFKYIIIHSSATTETQHFHATNLNQWHIAKGWCGIGYNFVVDLDGNVELGRSLMYQGAHCVAGGRNNDSIGICYIGGVDRHQKPADTRTLAQKLAIEAILQTLKAVWPNAEIRGHRDFECTDCPSFDARTEYSKITGQTIV